jgi:hypothetical protein
LLENNIYSKSSPNWELDERKPFPYSSRRRDLYIPERSFPFYLLKWYPGDGMQSAMMPYLKPKVCEEVPISQVPEELL